MKLATIGALSFGLLGSLIATGASAAGKDSYPTATKQATGKGGTLVIAYAQSAFPNLDTIFISGSGAEPTTRIGAQIYDGLTAPALNQTTATPKIVGDLATNWTVTSTATSSTYLFNLRKGVTFQDGTPWNAAAAVFNFNRWLNPNFQYYNPALAAVDASQVSTYIASATQTGPYQISVVTKGPNGILPQEITGIFFGSPTAIQKEGNANFALNPVGTGPFRFSSETPGQQLTLLPFAHYWAGKPKLSKLILEPISDPTARVAALRSGAVNFVDTVSPDQIPSLKALGYQVTANTYGQVIPIIFNTAVAPWNNVAARQAVGFALTRPAIANSLLLGTAAPAYQVATPGSPAYNAKNNYYTYDPTKAKALLAQAGYPNGFSFTLAVQSTGNGDPEPAQLAAVLQSNLAAVGIKMTIQVIDQTTLQSTLYKQGQFPAGTNATIEAFSFALDGAWNRLFATTGSMNVGKFSDPAVDAALGQGAATQIVSRQQTLYAKAAGLLTKDAAWIPIVSDRGPDVSAASVRNFTQPKTTSINLNTVWVK